MSQGIPVYFVMPGDPDARTGGYIYNKRIARELNGRGWRSETLRLEGEFPLVDCAAEQSVETCLASLDDGAVVVMDGLGMSAVPEVIGKHSGRLKLVGLIHLPLCDETGLDEATKSLLRARELAALSNTALVIVTSDFMVQRLGDLGACAKRVEVVRPGTDPAPQACGSGGDRVELVCVATVTPRKGHDVLLEALSGLRTLNWHLTCVGDDSRTPEWAEYVRALVEKFNLQDRVEFAGVKTGEALASCYHFADLFVLASEFESFGMVFTEAVSRGLPVVATTGGAIPQTVPSEACRLVEPGDTSAFKAVLGDLIGDRAELEMLRFGAVAARGGFDGWPESGAAFDRHLKALVAA